VRQTINKNERLKSRTTIDQIFRSRNDIWEKPLRAAYVLTSEQDALVKSGFVVPKKKIRLAVKRNLLKRRMKEAYRKNKIILEKLNDNKGKSFAVMFVYNSSEILPYEEIEEKIILILQALVKKHEKVGQ